MSAVRLSPELRQAMRREVRETWRTLQRCAAICFLTWVATKLLIAAAARWA